MNGYYLAAILAFQAPFIGIVIAIYYFATLGRNGYTRIQHTLARLLAVTCVGSMVFEILCGLIIYKLLAIDLKYYNVFCTIGYFFMLLHLIIFSEFCISQINKPPFIFAAAIRCLYFVVFVFLISRIGFSETKLFAYVENGEIHYGILDNAQTYICMLLYLLLWILIFVKYKDKNEFAKHEVYGKLLFADATIFVAIFIYGTIFFPYVLWIGYLLVLLYIYIASQKSSIYHDDLTHLNNRRFLIKHLSEKIKDDSAWTFVMFDVNSFKYINDNFGHAEGDVALEMVAKTLDLYAKEKNAEAYRYGGDEFSIIFNTNDEAEVIAMCKEISLQVEKCNLEENLPYQLSISSGYVIYDKEQVSTIPDIIEIADRMMYKNKNMFKNS